MVDPSQPDVPPGLVSRIRQRLAKPLPLSPTPLPNRLRVMTYNIHHGANRFGVLNLEAIAHTIEGCSPDVAALQEVDRHWSRRSETMDQPSWFAERLGMQVSYAATLRRPARDPGSPPAEYGLAVLSRRPMATSLDRHYTGWQAEARGLLAVDLKFGDGGPATRARTQTVRVINTHLSVHDRRLRAYEIAQLLAFADDRSDPPTVVAGDFNAVTRSEALRSMREGYRDAWQAGRGSPATAGRRRIDYLWLSYHLRPVQTVVVRSPASDHFAVVSDLSLDQEPAPEGPTST
jgi:endonuclease/exonuclease/phosphatase family metal-dependent hydrolase